MFLAWVGTQKMGAIPRLMWGDLEMLHNGNVDICMIIIMANSGRD